MLLALAALAFAASSVEAALPAVSSTIAASSTIAVSPAIAASIDPSVGSSGPIEEIVVTASRTPHPLSDSPITTEVISRAEIEASGARDAARVLERENGVEIESSYRGATVRLQGLDPEYVLVLVDGRRVTGRAGNAIDLARIPAENIERIEIVKGPASALYGSDALGGVINIITRRARDPFEASAGARYGSRKNADLTGTLGFSSDTGNIHLTGGWRRADAYDLDTTEPATSGSAYDEWNATARGDLALSSDLALELAAEYLRRTTQGVDASGAGAVFDRKDLVETFAATAGSTIDFTESTRLRTTAHFALFRDQYLQDQRSSGDLDQYQDTREHLAQLDAQFDARAGGSHLVTAGVELSNEHLDSPRIAGGSGDRGRLAIFAQDEWSLFDEPKAVIVPGARVDLDSQFGVHATPKIALRVDPSEHIVLRAGWAMGFRAPSFRELLLHFENPSAGYVVEGNPSLRPETSRGLNAGVELRAAKQLWGALSFFRNDIDDLIATTGMNTTPAPGAPMRFTYANVASAHTQGLEASLRIKPIAAITVELGYTLTDTEDEETGRPLEGRALHRATIQLRARESTTGIDANIRAALVGPRAFHTDDDGDGTVERIDADPYAAIDARIAKHLGPHLTLSAGIDNIFDARDARFLPIPPRTVFAGVDGRY